MLTWINNIRMGRKLTIIMLAIGILPVVIVVLVSYLQFQNALSQSVNDLQSVTQKSQSAYLLTWASERTQDMKTLAGVARISSMTPDTATIAIKQYFELWGIYETIFLAGTDGKSIASSDDQSYDLSERAYMKEALTGKSVQSDPLISKATGNVTIVFAEPVKSNGTIVGVILATVPVDTIAKLLVEGRTSETSESYLVNQQGYLVTAPRFSDEMKKAGLFKNRPELEYQLQTTAGKDLQVGQSGQGTYANYLGKKVNGQYTWIPEIKMGLVTEIQTSEANAAVTRLATICMFMIAIVILIVTILALVIARGISVPLDFLTRIAQGFAIGDLARDVNEVEKDKVRLRQDEIGDLGKAFDQLIIYMQELGNSAGAIARNDLTIKVTAKSARDELSNAFIRMVEGLRKAVGQVADSARNLNSASSQLATAARQAGEATNQIAATVQQVARGTQDQTQAVTRTAGSVEQMSRAIEGVAKGASEQGNAVAKASEITAEINTIIQQMAGNVAAVTRDSASATEAARNGASTVEQTLQGMQSIKTKVGVSAQKVQEMGERSNEIGVIVETIQDIASQTNLLALNAAIEAARAGEHGKGFAVVADEVRKLAERSSQATKEIGGLIGGIQKTVAEAVKAMDEGSKEVENGVRSANQSGDALSDILNASEAVNKQAQQAAEGAGKMNAASNQLVSAVDSVSAVVEENTAATEEMAAGSGEVTQAIESIASVSEENSAAIEEVSASAEEMSAQVEEVTASALSLAEMAGVLAQVVAQFKLTGV
jgi:methyl-accepting chemotaxis protein